MEVGAALPEGSTARIMGDALVFADAARRMFGGEFLGGVFLGGVFLGGEFLGGVFWGGEFRVSPVSTQRSDGYVFVCHEVDGDLRIWAGCRNFSIDKARAHWGDPNHHKHKESMAILESLLAMHEARK
jgi:hypothetical protein